MPIPRDLKWFAEREFRNPLLVEEEAVRFLDEVRDLYGAPIVVTSDARTAEDNERVGGSPTSWHLRGRAFDLRYPADERLAWRLVDAICVMGDAWRGRGVTIELELVYSARDKHVHLAVKRDGSPSRLIVAAD